MTPVHRYSPGDGLRESRSPSAASSVARAVEVRQPACVSQALAVERRRLHVRGVVQGVGFRPFVHRLAHRYGLAGFVLNDASGVVVEVEGDPGTLARSSTRSTAEAPPLAPVTRHRRRACSPRFEHGFAIVASEHGAAGRTTPVAAGCSDVRRLPARALRPCRSTLSLPVHQLHELRPTLHDRDLGSVRPGDARRWPGFRSAPPAAASTKIPAIAAFTPSRSPARTAGLS